MLTKRKGLSRIRRIGDVAKTVAMSINVLVVKVFTKTRYKIPDTDLCLFWICERKGGKSITNSH
jgi:hypothetical protein